MPIMHAPLELSELCSACTGPDLTCNLVHRTLIWSRRKKMCQTKCSVAVLRASPLPERRKPLFMDLGGGGSFRIPSPQQPSSSELKNSCRPSLSLPPASPPIPPPHTHTLPWPMIPDLSTVATPTPVLRDRDGVCTSKRPRQV